jgi:hypothetical protein
MLVKYISPDILLLYQSILNKLRTENVNIKMPTA